MTDFDKIPKSLNQSTSKTFSKSFAISQCTLYELFTIIIFEYLFYDLDEDQVKQEIIRNIKRLIYDENFLEGNYYVKKLVIQGFEEMENALNNLEDSQSSDKERLVTKKLLQKDLLKGFVECWR